MSFYLTVTFEYASREDAERDGYPGENARSYVCEPVSDTPPVVLPGLVKGGEFSTMREWRDIRTASIYVDANGKAFSGGHIAVQCGALPITWYTEAP